VARGKFEQLAPERQREILAIAADEFSKNGFGGTSYNRLLARAGLGKSSAYYYFADKQDLFLTAVKACYRTFFDGLGELPQPTTSSAYWSFIEAITRRGFEFMQQDPTSAALIQCFVRERAMLDVLASAELLHSVEHYYVELIQVGQALGAVRRDLPLGLLAELGSALSSVFDRWFVATAADADATQLGELTRQFTELSRQLFEPKPRQGQAPVQRKRARRRAPKG